MKGKIYNFRHYISILSENATSSFQQENKWEVKYNIFAEIKALQGSSVNEIDRLSFGNIVTEEYFLFKIRFLPDLDNNMRISFKNRLFSIKRIINFYEQNKILEIVTLAI